MDKEAVIRNFSRNAYFYDKYADVQKRIGAELLKLINKESVDSILEIGCGTGNYTLLLREKFSGAEIKAIDISAKMIEAAAKKISGRRIAFMIEDAETVSLDEKFDLITSNACFQWFEDLDAALMKYKKLLKKDGIILFSMFGPGTFWELNISLKRMFKDISIEAADFIGQNKIGKMLNRHFKQVVIAETVHTESFLCLRDFLNKIKYMGVRGEGLNNKIFFSRQVLKRLEESYADEFKGIKATYQILFCRGLKTEL